MRLLKIGAIWCSGCLVMNNVISKVKKNYDFDFQELDIDMDEEEAKKYDPKDKLPVFIILDNDKEIDRFTGEYKYEEFVEKLESKGVLHEKKN